MASFFLAEIDVIDREKYESYIERVSRIVESYGGVYVFRSGSVLPVTEDWRPDRMILIRFNSIGDMQRCFDSEEYRSIKHLREQSTRSRAIVVQDDENANKAMDGD